MHKNEFKTENKILADNIETTRKNINNGSKKPIILPDNNDSNIPNDFLISPEISTKTTHVKDPSIVENEDFSENFENQTPQPQIRSKMHKNTDLPLTDSVKTFEISENFTETNYDNNKNKEFNFSDIKTRNKFIKSNKTYISIPISTKISEKPIDLTKKETAFYYYGVLYRYSPEIQTKYVKRVGEAGEHSFQYYNTNYGYWLSFPLLTIEYKDILGVRCVKIENTKKERNAKHLFEIFIRMKSEHNSKELKIEKSKLELTKKTLDFGSEESKFFEPKQKTYITNGISFISKERAQNYLDFITKNASQISKVHKITIDEKAARINKFYKSGTQSYEQINEKMMFGTDTMEECEKWVSLLLWIISDLS